MDIVILGAGGHGKVVADILLSAGVHRVVGFLDADASLKDQLIMGLPVLGDARELPRLKAKKVRGAIVGIGDNRTRHRYLAEVIDAGLEPITAIHPSATIAKSATIGRNVAVAAGAIVCAEARVGDSSIINTAAVVEHECDVGVAVHIAPGALLAGRVRVGDYTLVGLGARVIQCLTIGSGATVGAGAVVTRDVDANVTVIGVPARAKA